MQPEISFLCDAALKNLFQKSLAAKTYDPKDIPYGVKTFSQQDEVLIFAMAYDFKDFLVALVESKPSQKLMEKILVTGIKFGAPALFLQILKRPHCEAFLTTSPHFVKNVFEETKNTYPTRSKTMELFLKAVSAPFREHLKQISYSEELFNLISLSSNLEQ